MKTVSLSMSEMMMTSFLDLNQQYHDVSKHGDNMFQDTLHCYDFLPETETENGYRNHPKLIDNREEFQSNSEEGLFDLNVTDLQFSDLLLVPGMNTQDESAMKSPQVALEICQNLEEDIFKTYPCLADAVSPSFEEQYSNPAVNASCNVYQRQNTLTELDRLVENNDVVHDRFKTRSLSLDSAFVNYQEEKNRLMDCSISTTSMYSECIELHPLKSTCVINSDTMPNSVTQFQHQSFHDENSVATTIYSLPETEFDSNGFHACSPLTKEKTLEDVNSIDSSTDSVCQLQFLPQSSQSVDENKGSSKESLQSINVCTDNSTEVGMPNRNTIDSQEELAVRGASVSPEPLLPTTLDSISCEATAEVSLESLPESLLHLESVPKATCAPNKPSSRRKRGRKLWEFLLDLLEDPVCNPSLIRWEDKAKGIFRLKEQEIIARKWGKRREKKDDLSYDYFARALRYHYKSKMLVSVPERKLVYKFGPKVLSEMK